MNGCYSIVKANLISVTANGQFAKVQSLGKVFEQVPFLYPYGYFASVKGGEDDSLCLLLKVMDSDSIVYALPYRPTTQPVDLLEGEVIVGNFDVGSTVKFKSTGDVDVSAVGNVNITTPSNVTVTATGNVTVTGALINLGAAAGTVLTTTDIANMSAGGDAVLLAPPSPTSIVKA